LVLGVAQGLVTFVGVYFKNDFKGQPPSVHVAALVGLVLAFVTPGFAAYSTIEARQEKLKGDAYTALLVVLTKIADKAKVPAREIGLNAYIVRSPRITAAVYSTAAYLIAVAGAAIVDEDAVVPIAVVGAPFVVAIVTLGPWAPYQARLARVRLANFPPASTILWSWGKGFVGECWARQNMVIDRHLPTRYGPLLGCDEMAWKAAPAELRLGLSFQEWETTQQRYKYIRVAPILSPRRSGRAKYVGCVSLDTAHDAHAAPLGTDEVRDLLQNAADAIDGALRSQR
jgi:hypothetical protein